MLVLSVDSSSSTATCSLVSSNGILGEINLNDKKQHSILLMDLIDRLLKDYDLKVKDLDGFVISQGPGSFTGLRIGMATLKGMALGSNKPLVCISALEGLAYNVVSFNGIICPIMDALRNNVYTCLYKSENNCLESLTNEDCLSLEELVAILKDKNEPIIFLGDGVAKHKDYLKENLPNCTFAPNHSNFPHASSIGELGIKLLENGISHNLNTSAPIYLRKSQAEREYEQRMGI